METDSWRGQEPIVVMPHFAITCGKVVLYQHAFTKLDVMSGKVNVVEEPGPRIWTYRHKITHYEYGKPLVEFFVTNLRVTSNADAPPWRVVLSVDELSEPTDGPPLFEATEKKERGYSPGVYRTGRVSAASRGAPVRPGTRVSLEVRPIWKSDNFNCEITVTGVTRRFAFCPEAKPLRVELTHFSGATLREDLMLDLGRNLFVYSEKESEEKEAWSVTVALDPASSGARGP
jgi:hypothetical protein